MSRRATRSCASATGLAERLQPRLRRDVERLCAGRSGRSCGTSSSCCRSMSGSSPAPSGSPTTVPRGFIPTLDQGYAIVVDPAARRLLPVAHRRGGAAGLEDHAGDARRAGRGRLRGLLRRDLHQRHQRGGDLRRGSSPSTSGSGRATRPTKIIGDLFGRMQQIEEAFIIAIPPPPVRGLGNSGGFKIQLQDRTGRRRRAGFSPPPTS